MKPNVFVKLSAAVVIDGKVVTASSEGKPSIVEVSYQEAKDIIGRGKGEPATEADMPDEDPGAHPDIAALNSAKKELAADPTPPAGNPRNNRRNK